MNVCKEGSKLKYFFVATYCLSCGNCYGTSKTTEVLFQSNFKGNFQRVLGELFELECSRVHNKDTDAS